MKKTFISSLIIFFILFFQIVKFPIYSYNFTSVENEKISLMVKKIGYKIQFKGDSYKENLINKLFILQKNFPKGTRNYNLLEALIDEINMIKYKGDNTEDSNEILKRNSKIINIILDGTMTNDQIDNLLFNNINNLKDNDNIFIIKKNKNIPINTLSYTTKKIFEYNEKIRIFIDQEGGLVNRYNIFDDKYTFSYYLSIDNKLQEKYDLLGKKTKDLFLLGIKGRETFISAKKVGEIYLKIEEIEEKKSFLDFISYFELFSTKLAGVNTFGLDTDLDFGNPAISLNERSFSNNVKDYISYGNYFVKNGKELGISIYIKHYPGHGFGKVDTHYGVLEYTNKNKEYIENNFWVFESIMKNAKDIKSNVGIMVGHIVLPEEYKERFLGNIGEAEYILTDDLGMKGYKIAKDKKYVKNFFTTNEIIKNKKVIQVTTGINQIK